MSELNQPIVRQFAKHSKFTIKGLMISLWVATIVMFILLLCGVYKISIGIILEFRNIEPEGLIDILRGLELVFVSPLLYLLILSLTKYISATRPEVDNGVALNNPDNKKKFINFAMMEIMNVKILTIGLFISILTLHSIQYVLQDELHAPPISFIMGVFVVLIVYYFILDKLSERLRFAKD